MLLWFSHDPTRHHAHKQSYANPATPGGASYENPATPSPLIPESPQSGSSHYSGPVRTPMYSDYMTPSPGVSPLTPGGPDYSPRTPGSPMESGEMKCRAVW